VIQGFRAHLGQAFNHLVRKPRNLRIIEVSRYPNTGVTLNDFPLPFLAGDMLCVTSSDGGRRDNAPNTAGELGAPGGPRGKVSCWSQRLLVPGLPLPVRVR